MILTGKANPNGVAGACILKSVLITNESGGSLGISIHVYNAGLQSPLLRVVALDDVTTQVVFEGISFPAGFWVVPDSGMTFYCVEYDANQQ